MIQKVHLGVVCLDNREYYSKAVSNNNPVSFRFNTKLHEKSTTRWKLNTSLLKDKGFDSYFKRELATSMEIATLRTPLHLFLKDMDTTNRVNI